MAGISLNGTTRITNPDATPRQRQSKWRTSALTWKESDFTLFQKRAHFQIPFWKNLITALRLGKRKITFLCCCGNASDDFDMPCIRLDTSTSGGSRINAYIFMDGVCDRSSTITRSTYYRRLELEKHVVPDMCSNENSLCTDHRAVPSCTSESASICRSYCKVCQTPLPWVNETFPRALQGKWQQISLGRKYDIVEFKQGLMTYPSKGGVYVLTSKAECRRGGALAPHPTEFSLLSTYDNGCSPRVTRAIIASRR